MRLNWANRQSPGEFDVSAPTAETCAFDHRRNTTPGSQSWPDKFGPANIRKAWKAGLFVFAEVQGFPYPVVAKEVQWTKANHVLMVKVPEGVVVAERLFTRSSAKGVTVGGILIES